MSRSIPSSITSRKILSGIEIVTGESIIMPIARRMLEVTKSMTKNGCRWHSDFKSILELARDICRDKDDEIVGL